MVTARDISSCCFQAEVILHTGIQMLWASVQTGCLRLCLKLFFSSLDIWPIQDHSIKKTILPTSLHSTESQTHQKHLQLSVTWSLPSPLLCMGRVQLDESEWNRLETAFLTPLPTHPPKKAHSLQMADETQLLLGLLQASPSQSSFICLCWGGEINSWGRWERYSFWPWRSKGWMGCREARPSL